MLCDISTNECDLDRFFAMHLDEDISLAWAGALENLRDSQDDLLPGDWPQTWVIAWVVSIYVGIWEGDGIASLWESDQEYLSLFQESLNTIGAGVVADFISRSLDAVGRDKLSDWRHAESDAVRTLADDWNGNLTYYSGIAHRHLSAYLRKHRYESKPLLEDMLMKLPSD